MEIIRRGRKTKYSEAYNEQAYKLALLGATDNELSLFFEIDPATLNRWKQRYPEFCESLKKGKDVADAAVVEKLYQRALGYSHPHQEIMLHQKTGDPVVVDTTKHYPPDTTAIIFWLKNRQPERWRDKQQLQVAAAVEIEDKTSRLDYSKLTDEELETLLKICRNAQQR